jgi:hypothetical protein
LLIGACTKGVDEPNVSADSQPKELPSAETRAQLKAEGLRAHMLANGIDSLLLSKAQRKELNDYLNQVAGELMGLMANPECKQHILSMAHNTWSTKGIPLFYLSDFLAAYHEYIAQTVRTETGLVALARGKTITINGQSFAFKPEIFVPGVNARIFPECKSPESIIVSHYMEKVGQKKAVIYHTLDQQGHPEQEVKFAEKLNSANTIILRAPLAKEHHAYSFRAEDLGHITSFSDPCYCDPSLPGRYCLEVGTRCSNWLAGPWCGVFDDVVTYECNPYCCYLIVTV